MFFNRIGIEIGTTEINEMLFVVPADKYFQLSTTNMGLCIRSLLWNPESGSDNKHQSLKTESMLVELVQ